MLFARIGGTSSPYTLFSGNVSAQFLTHTACNCVRIRVYFCRYELAALSHRSRLRPSQLDSCRCSTYLIKAVSMNSPQRNRLRSILVSAANALGSRCPQPMLSSIEQFASLHQGKGIGTACDLEVRQCAALLGRPPRVVIDAGGNRGDYSSAVRQRFPSCAIHIFEPAPPCVQSLKERFSADHNVFIHECALSNEENVRMLWTDAPGSGLASLTRRNLAHHNKSMSSFTMVKCASLDDLVSRGSLSNIDWIKLDVEGHELDALSGADQTLGSTSLIQFEFGGCNIDTRTFFHDFWKFFQPRGFRLYRLTSRKPVAVTYYSESLEHFRTTNYVAVRASNGPSVADSISSSL